MSKSDNIIKIKKLKRTHFENLYKYVSIFRFKKQQKNLSYDQRQ